MRSLRSLIPALLLVGVAGCGPDETPPPEPTAESVALDLFVLALDDDPQRARVQSAFGAFDDDVRYATLLDAIRELPAERNDDASSVVEMYTLEGGDRTGFDLEGPVGDGGVARYSVLLDTTTAPGTIVWFSGPGVEWPERRRRSPGISTSAPPTAGE